MKNHNKFIELLIKTREDRGLLKQDVASLFGWTPMYYGRFENGQLKPSGTNIKKFAKFLDITEEELIKIIEFND